MGLRPVPAEERTLKPWWLLLLLLLTRELVGHLKQQLNEGCTDSEVLAWLREVMPTASPPPVHEEPTPGQEYAEDLPGWAPPQPTAEAWQSHSGAWTHWEGDWWYFVDPDSKWWYWERWGSSLSAQTWSPDAAEWPKPAPSKPGKNLARETVAAKSKVLACRTSDWQKQVPPVLVTFEHLKETLGRGEVPPGNIVVVSCKEEFASVQDLWQAFSDPAGLTVVGVDKAVRCEGMTSTQVSLKREKAGSKLEKVGIAKVSSQHTSPWIQEATKVDSAFIPVAAKVTVRVTATQEYRAQFLEEAGSQDSPALILQSLARASGVQVAHLLGGNWQSHDRGRQAQIVGYLRLREEIAEKVLLTSGDQGVFVSLAGNANRLEPFWVRALPDENRENYYLRVMALKRTRVQPVLFRPGGGHDLGFPRLPQDQDDKWARHFTATGIPRAWDSTDVSHFLKSQRCRLVDSRKDVTGGFSKRWPPKLVKPPGGTFLKGMMLGVSMCVCLLVSASKPTSLN